MDESVEKYNPHHDAHGRFASGGGAGAGGAGAKGGKGKKLSSSDEKKMNQLAIDLFNHKQGMPMSVRTGKKTPQAEAYRQKFSQIVDQAANILGVSAKEAHNELQSRMGVK